jgi:hypothetical protein
VTPGLATFDVGDLVVFRGNRCVVTSVRGGRSTTSGYLRVLEPGPDSQRQVGDELYAFACECEPDEEVG